MFLINTELLLFFLIPITLILMFIDIKASNSNDKKNTNWVKYWCYIFIEIIWTAVFFSILGQEGVLGRVLSILLVLSFTCIYSELHVVILNDGRPEFYLWIYSISQMIMTITAIIVMNYYSIIKNLLTDVEAFGRIILLLSIMCIGYSSWIVFFIFLLFIEESPSAVVKDFIKDIRRKDYLSILTPLLNTVSIITGFVLLAKSSKIANIQVVHFLWLNDSNNTKNVFVSVAIWMMIIIPSALTLIIVFIFLLAFFKDFFEKRENRKIQKNFNDVENVDQFIKKLYDYSRKHRVTDKKFEDIVFFVINHRILSLYERHVIIERYKQFNLSKILKKLNADAIKELLLPENFSGEEPFFFGSEDFNRRYGHEIIRYYTEEIELKERIIKELYEKNSDLEDRLISVMLEKGYKDKTDGESIGFQTNAVFKGDSGVSESEGLNTVSMVRDIYHHTKTPLRTISQAAKNIQIFNNSPEKQEESIKIITNQVSLVELVLDGYRQLAMEWPDNQKEENIKPYLMYAAQSAAAIDGKTVSLIFDDPFPDKICYQGNKYAAIILKPLIDNAVEASPDGEDVLVKCKVSNNECIVSVENKCIITPRQCDLEKSHFTTKRNGGGDGLDSVRRLAEKGNFKFTIMATEETGTVKAEMVFSTTK